MTVPIFYGVLITICLSGKAAILVKKFLENQKDKMQVLLIEKLAQNDVVHPLKVNNIDLCAIAVDYKAKKGKPGRLSIDDYEKAKIKDILEKLNIPLPKKMTGHLMAEAIYNYISDNCPDQCIDPHITKPFNAYPLLQNSNNCGMNNQRWNHYLCGNSGSITLLLVMFFLVILNYMLNWLILDELALNKEAAALLIGIFYEFISCNCIPLIFYLTNDKLYKNVKNEIFC